MNIVYLLETRINNWNKHRVSIECSYREFMTLCEMIGGNVPDGDLEKNILTEFEVAQDAVKATHTGSVNREQAQREQSIVEGMFKDIFSKDIEKDPFSPDIPFE